MRSRNFKYIIINLGIILLIFSAGCEKDETNELVILSNNKIEVGILPEVGGRIVLLRKPGKENILKADENLWKNSKYQKPEISAYSNFKAFNGHITWVGPQKEWWIHQTLNMKRNKAKADWPPDPYLIYGKNDIINKTDSSISMVGLESPISGVKLIQTITINKLGTVTITSTMQNITDKNISRDLWMLTRMDGFAEAYVPIENDQVFQFVHNENETEEPTPYRIENNYFTFIPSIPKNPKIEQVQEVHIYPAEGFMAGITENQMLIIRFEKIDQMKVHTNHGLVELYNSINVTGDERLLELEVHGEYKTLSPGETLSLTETWDLYTFSGNDKKIERSKLLDKYK